MTPQPLADELGQALITAASAGPSPHNCRPWRFHFDRATRSINVHAAVARRDPRRGSLGWFRPPMSQRRDNGAVRPCRTSRIGRQAARRFHSPRSGGGSRQVRRS
ncbi:hypothetical protein GCM10023235_76640 [Kitasatospora terrestris]|uniref:Nitroreductase domain-containing protein n=1 Tax=Kitasatospora terrestris TaxID=258051 RepID=A0ABP9ESJ1_9ACTN